MAKLLLGIVIGVALTVMAVVALQPSKSSEGGSAEGAPPPRSEPQTPINEYGIRNGSIGQAPRGSDTSVATTEASSLGPSSTTAMDITGRAAEPPPLVPIILPREFDYLTVNRNLFHERLQHEPLDPTWFAQAEADLRSWFTGHPEIIAKYGFPTINCRTTGCAIAFVATADNSTFADAEGNVTARSVSATFRQDNRAIFEGPLGERFYGQLGVVGDAHIENGVTTIYWFLARADQQTSAPQSQSREAQL